MTVDLRSVDSWMRDAIRESLITPGQSETAVQIDFADVEPAASGWARKCCEGQSGCGKDCNKKTKDVRDKRKRSNGETII